MVTMLLTRPETAEHPPHAEARRSILSRRWVRWTIVIAALLLVVFYAGGGWMFSNEIRSGALEVETPGSPAYDVEVLAVADGSVTLSLTGTENDHVAGIGLRGIEWPGGYGWVGDVATQSADTVVRPFTPYPGAEPLGAGTLVDMTGYVLPPDPAALGVGYEEITYPSPLGDMGGVHFDAGGDSWIVMVHGKSAPLREAYRMVEPLVGAGYDALVISYRNDDGMPADPSGMYGYGAAEWPDLEAAVQYALDHGAQRVALYGYSMGGGIVMAFMLESDLAAHVDAVVLDSGMLDFGATIDFRADDRSLPLIRLPVPQSLTSVAKLVAGWRFGVDWGELDHVGRAGDLATPILAFHGLEDDSVPIEPARELAEAHPASMTLVEVPEAGHVLNWNVDPQSYEAHVLDFLADHLEA